MPIIEIGDARVHYTDEGAGDETIVFSHGLLMSGEMFSAQVSALKSRYRCHELIWPHFISWMCCSANTSCGQMP